MPTGGAGYSASGGDATSGNALQDHSFFQISSPIQNEGVKVGRDLDFSAGDVKSNGNPAVAFLGGERPNAGFLSIAGGDPPSTLAIVGVGAVLLVVAIAGIVLLR